MNRGEITIPHPALAPDEQDGRLNSGWRNRFHFVAHEEKTIRTFHFSGKGKTA